MTTSASAPSSAAGMAAAGGAAPAPQQEALRDASAAFAGDLAELQRVGSASLGSGGDVAGFYATFATATRDAEARYEALEVPAESASVRDRLLALLGEQAAVLDAIAAGAAQGEDASLAPQLEQLTELLGDVSTTNAELLRSMGVEAPVAGA